VVENYANFYYPNNSYHVECSQTSICNFVTICLNNNGLIQQRTFVNHVTRRREGRSMRPWSENPSLRRV